MKLTISQEGMNPITIRTVPEKTIKSEENGNVSGFVVGAGLNLLPLVKAIGYIVLGKKDLGTFSSAKDMFNAPLFLKYFKEKVQNKYGDAGDYPSEQEVKNDCRTDVKTSFLQKIFMNRFDKKLINQVGTSSLVFKVINGITVSICGLDTTSLFTGASSEIAVPYFKKLLVATAYVYEGKNKSKIKSVPICCGQLETYKQVRTATESESVFTPQNRTSNGGGGRRPDPFQ